MVRRELCKSMGALLIFGVREVEGEETCQSSHGYQLGGAF
jgi:hypothetical protein